MDEVSQYNIERWNALVDVNALFTRPDLNLDAQSAREWIDPDGRLGDVKGKNVLLLASGGGQQSAAFVLLGAQVTVVDLADKQLERDREAAVHYGADIKTVKADMRDLSVLDSAAFDLVYHPYSLNFVPDSTEVFTQVARVVRPGGMYYFMCANPFASGLTEQSWNGTGYLLQNPYQQGAKIIYQDSDWVYDRSKYPDSRQIHGPQEFCQTLSTLINGLTAHGFVIRHTKEIMADVVDLSAEPGSWDHFTAIMPPWLAFWTVFTPDRL